MERKLASIRTIKEIHPIVDADAIETAVVDGWKVVCKKGQFAVGDSAVYFEIDSLLPIEPRYEFLRKSSYTQKEWLVSDSNPEGEGFRLRTAKLRGAISQGLLLPLSDFDEISKNEVGDDLTNILNIVKYDPPIIALNAIGHFPYFIPKTDSERVQNIQPSFIENYEDCYFEESLKIDGSSITVFRYNDHVGACSRNLEIDWVADSRLKDLIIGTNLLDNLVGNYAIQGELVGPGIQKNREKFSDTRFYVFNVFSIDNQKYLTSKEREIFLAELSEKGTVLHHVPIYRKVKILKETVDDILEGAMGPSINNPIREGLVYKLCDDPSINFKAISNEYLLKHKE